MIVKRVIAILTMIAIIFSFGVSPVFAVDKRVLSKADNEAEVYLGKDVLTKGFKEVGVGQTNNPLASEKAGESCWELPIRNANNCYIFFNLDESMKAKEFDGSAYTVEVDYFDTGNGFFKIMYRDCHGEMQTAKLLYTEGERVWKTVSIKLYDAEFKGNAYDSEIINPAKTSESYMKPGDLIIQSRSGSTNPLWSREAIDIKRVKVIKEKQVYPVYTKAWNDKTGGAYKWFEESKLLYNDVRNMTDKPQKFNITHKLVGKKWFKSLTKTEGVELAPGEMKTLEFDFGEIDYCDLYEYFATIEIEGGISYTRKLTELAILKTDPDGIKNDELYYCGHAERQTDESSEQFFEVLSLSNAGGYRSSFSWAESLGTYRYPTEFTKLDTSTQARSVKQVKKHGLKYLPILSGPPTGEYFKSWSDYPVNETQLDLWRNYIAVVSEYLKDVTDHYEILNEPNISNFNYDLENFWGAEYAELIKVTKEEIIKHDPTAKIGGPSLTGVEQDYKGTPSSAWEFFMEAMDAGMGESLDSIVLHPYWYGWGYDSFEEGPRAEQIQGYKDVYKKYTGKEAEVWHTESGISAYDVPDRSVITKGYYDCRFVLTAKSKDVSDITCLFTFDRADEIVNDRENMFGHVSAGYDNLKKWDKRYFPTEAFLSVTGLNYVMANSEEDGIYDPEGRPNIKLNKYKSDKFDADIATFWSIKDTENLTLDLGCDSITLYDCYGNASEIKSDDGIYSFMATAEPKYIVGKFKAFKYQSTNKFELLTQQYKVAKDDKVNVGVKLNVQDKGYTVAADVPEGVTITSNCAFDKNKSAKIEINNTLPIGTSFPVNLKITDRNGKVVYYQNLSIESTIPVSLDIFLKIAEGGDVSKWNATAKILNHSNTKAVKGRIEFKSPDVVSKIKNIDVGVIPKNATGAVTFGLPKIVRKGQYTFEYDFVSENGERYSFETPIDLTIAPYAKTKPTIDGVLSPNEWVYDAAMFADSVDQIKLILGWGGKEDLSGKAAVMWDEDNMYMYAEVTDDVFFNNLPLSTHWDGDSLQVGIFYGLEGFIAMGQSGTTFHEFGLALSSSEGAGAYRTLSQSNTYPAGLITDAEVAIINKGAKTVYEVKVPWKSLLNEGHQPKENDMLGFSFLINDNDGTGRRGWIEYASGIGETKNVELFTYLTLIK